MKAMILAAGLGARLKPLTNDTPKSLLLVGKYTLIERAINRLIKCGVSEFVINVSHLANQIKDSFANYNEKVNIQFIDEPYPYGTGGALINAINYLGKDPFILCNSDVISEIDLNKLPENTEVAHLIGIKNPEHNLKGDFSLVDGYVFIREKENDLTWSGLSIINPEILKGHLSHPYPFDIWTIILKPLISQSKVTAHFDDSLWMDVGTFDRLKLARKRLKDEN